MTALAQAALSAARGAFLHGMAGELAQLKFGSRGVLADDLAEYAAENLKETLERLGVLADDLAEYAAQSAAYLENKLYKQ